MIYNNNFVKLQLSDDEMDVLLEIAAMMDMSISDLVTGFAHDMVYAWACNTEDSCTKLVGKWFETTFEEYEHGSSFLPWISVDESLDIMLLHVESIFKSLHRICCPAQNDYFASSKILMRIFACLLDRFADMDQDAEDIHLECLSTCPKAISRNIRAHLQALREVYAEYLADTKEPASFKLDMIHLVLWWQNIYLGE